VKEREPEFQPMFNKKIEERLRATGKDVNRTEVLKSDAGEIVEKPKPRKVIAPTITPSQYTQPKVPQSLPETKVVPESKPVAKPALVPVETKTGFDKLTVTFPARKSVVLFLPIRADDSKYFLIPFKSNSENLNDLVRTSTLTYDKAHLP